MRDAAGQPDRFIGVIEDITQRKNAETALREERRILEILNETGKLLASQLDLQSLVQAVTDAATQLSGAQFGSFFYNVTDENGDAFLLYTLSGAPREAFANFGNPRATALFGPTFRGELPIRLDDVLTAIRKGAKHDNTTTHSARSARTARQIQDQWYHSGTATRLQMSTNGVRAAIYLRVSRDDQTTENQRLVLARVAEHRGWLIVQTYEDQGISGAKGRDQRPAFDTMLKDAVRRRYGHSDGLVDRSTWPERAPRGQCPGRTRCCRHPPVLRPAGNRFLDADGPSHDPDGVGVWRAGKIDAPRQSPCRLGSRPPAGEEARPPKVSPKVENAIRTHLSAGKAY